MAREDKVGSIGMEDMSASSPVEIWPGMALVYARTW
jgi:hypothetical protein